MSWRGAIDPAFDVIGDSLAGYADVVAGFRDEEMGVEMTIEELAVETPIELSLHVDEAGNVEIGCVPPLYRVAVTVEPVFHALRFRATVEVNERG